MRHHLFTAIGFVVACGLSASAIAAPPHEKQGFLGVMVAPGQEGERGLLIQEIFPDSPAAKAGLKAGDRIIKIGDQEPKDVDGFMKIMDRQKPGEKVKLTIVRGDKEQSIDATLGERPAIDTARRPDDGHPRGTQGPAHLGVTIQPLTPELRQQTNVEAKEGIVVVEVFPESPAEKAGLKHGDVITKVGDKAVKDTEELREMVQQSAGKELSLAVVRGSEKLTVKATPQSGLVGYFAPMEFDSMIDPSRRIQELERRIAELEKRIREMERKSSK
jgi:serine protease Do